MGYSTSLPGLREASLDALVTLIQAGITSLNTALASISPAVPMVWTTAQVTLGDTFYLPTSRIAVVAGGEQDARDMEVEEWFMPLNDTQGYRETLYTNIYGYIHEDELPNEDAVAQMAVVERACARISDHVRRRILNAPANVTMLLASQEHNSAGDILCGCRAKEVYAGRAVKSFGKTIEVPSFRIIHVGYIA